MGLGRSTHDDGGVLFTILVGADQVVELVQLRVGVIVDFVLPCGIPHCSGDHVEYRHKGADAAFEGLDPDWETRFKNLAKDHLEVIAGDVSEDCFGLAEDDFQRLADKVDRICHSAALVNHRLAYQHLFEPNVVGTAEIIRLALTQCIKPVDFISSSAVEPLLDSSNGNNEDSPLFETVTLGDFYAAGYGASKWAGELLLYDANRRYGLPVNIFRGDMMLAHQRFKGHINSADMLTRLLYSIVVTGLAPASFYQAAPDGSRAKAHYDGTPVDVVAAAVVGVSDHAHTDVRTYNVINYHGDDGVSLDSFVDWLESAGYPITRIENNADWYERMQQKLKALPDQQRRQSAIDILMAFGRPYPANGEMAGCDRFQGLVQGLKIGPDVPHLSEAFIHKCLEDMRLLGLIDS